MGKSICQNTQIPCQVIEETARTTMAIIEKAQLCHLSCQQSGRQDRGRLYNLWSKEQRYISPFPYTNILRCGFLTSIQIKQNRLSTSILILENCSNWSKSSLFLSGMWSLRTCVHLLPESFLSPTPAGEHMLNL